MRLALLPAIMLMVASCGQTPNNEAEVSSETIEVSEKEVVVANAQTTLAVEGMMCEVGCVSTIQNALNETPGVSICDVDFENSQAVVDFDSTQIDQKAIIEVINKLADGHYTASVL